MLENKELKQALHDHNAAEARLMDLACHTVAEDTYKRFISKRHAGMKGWDSCPVELLASRIAGNIMEGVASEKQTPPAGNIPNKQYVNLHLLLTMLELRGVTALTAMHLIAEQLNIKPMPQENPAKAALTGEKDRGEKEKTVKPETIGEVPGDFPMFGGSGDPE